MTDFNKKSLLEKLRKDLGWSIDLVTLWTWEKKEYLQPSSYMKDGKRMVPIYYERDLGLIIAKLKQLNKLGKIRIKGYDKKADNINSKKTSLEMV